MMKKLLLFFVLAVGFLAGCESEETIPVQPFVVGFETRSYNYRQIPGSQTIVLEFSERAKYAGLVRIRVTPSHCEYGVDFETFPAPENSELIVPIIEGATQTTFEFRNLIFPFDQSDKEVKFEVVAIDYPEFHNIQGFSSAVVSFAASLGGTAEPVLGGPNQGNQVYFDLSTDTATEVWRESWDLGFYSGDQFRVTINASLYMAAKQLDATDIDAVTEASVAQYQPLVAIGTFDPANAAYVDDPNGHITGTAISEISVSENDNKVYLVNMGYAVGTATPAVGSVAVAGNPRGWKKIRILRDGNSYRLQYADLNSSTHEEVLITKDPAFNFTFFSFNANSVVSVEPEKDKWDLNFTVFTNIIEGSGSYGFSDFVVNNLKAGVKAYRLNVSEDGPYEDFELANVDESRFENDQRTIGADWRDVFSSVYGDRYYVLKDADGNHYAIRMLAFKNNSGVRGYPKFEYRVLQ